MLALDQAQELLMAAKSAAEVAYAPYSHFAVGAALLTDSGEIFTGVNIENASYGLTICAERAAVSQAVSRGFQSFKAIALWAKETPNGAVTPCGACRQVLAEFMKGSSVIVMAQANADSLRQLTMADLLPESFAL